MLSLPVARRIESCGRKCVMSHKGLQGLLNNIVQSHSVLGHTTCARSTISVVTAEYATRLAKTVASLSTSKFD